MMHYYHGRSTIRIDEAPLTGESLPVEKLVGTEGRITAATPDASPPIIQDQVGMVYGGTTVVVGGGVAIVTATGPQTEFGKIQQGVMDAKQDEAKEKSPLTKQLDAFGNQLTVLIGLICGLVWLASIPKMIHGGTPNSVFASSLEAMIYYTKVAVALDENTRQYNTIQDNKIQYKTMKYNTIQYIQYSGNIRIITDPVSLDYVLRDVFDLDSKRTDGLAQA